MTTTEKPKFGGNQKGAGRKKGSPNKKTAELQERVAASGMTPLDFLLKVMRDSRKPMDVRLDAAKAAAPYVHAKLSSVEMKGAGQGGAIVVEIVKFGQNPAPA